MKKTVLTISALLLMVVSIIAQDRVNATLYKKDGSTEDVMMYVYPNRPWVNQKGISVFDPSLKDEKRIKGKYITKYKPKDLVAYEVEGNYFESQKVMVAGRGDYGSTLKSLPNYTFIEKMIDGPITVYKAYGYPPGVASGVSFEEIYADLRANPEYFVRKESEDKMLTMTNMNIERWIEDAPETSEKFAKGEFGNYKRKENKKVANFLKGQLENENTDLIMKVIIAYNEEMSK